MAKRRIKQSTQSTQTDHPKKKGDYKEHLKEPWLEAFRNSGTILAACKSVRVSRTTINEWRKTDADFSARFIEADIDVSERIETAAIYRAVNGDRKPLIRNGAVVFQQDKDGKIVLDAQGRPVPFTITEFSDAMQIFLLKCRLPHKYQEKIKQEIDLRIVNVLSSEFLTLIRRTIPDKCPHCSTVLAITPRIAKELETLSARLVHK